ncbi:MAG TPA: isoprenylcysteine carboxylmethyltransferase family protein [Acidobacteriaceae bacterium]
MNAFRICTTLWTVWLLIWILWAFRSKQTKERESPASRLAYGIPAWAAMYSIFVPHSLGFLGDIAVFPASTVLNFASIAITVLGFAITLWARFALGTNWSGTVTIKVNHELIRTGPYRVVRHPIYTGLIVSTIGTALALNLWRGVLAIFLIWLAFTIKRLKEEQFMRQIFGEEYTAYSRTTGAIFPALLRRNS